MPDVTAPLFGPVLCVCCRNPLELTCPSCGPAPVQASFDAAAVELAASGFPAKIRTNATRQYAPKACALCHQEFTPTGPRSVVCDRCKGQKQTNKQTKSPVKIGAGLGAGDAE